MRIGLLHAIGSRFSCGSITVPKYRSFHKRQRTSERRDDRVVEGSHFPNRISLYEHAETKFCMWWKLLTIGSYDAAKFIGHMSNSDTGCYEPDGDVQCSLGRFLRSCCKDGRKLSLNLTCSFCSFSADHDEVGIGRVHLAGCLGIVIIKTFCHFSDEASDHLLVFSTVLGVA